MEREAYFLILYYVPNPVIPLSYVIYLFFIVAQ